MVGFILSPTALFAKMNRVFDSFGSSLKKCAKKSHLGPPLGRPSGAFWGEDFGNLWGVSYIFGVFPQCFLGFCW